LGNEKVRVCKTYYLLTLAISEQFVYTTLKNREVITGVPIPLNVGKHRKNFISEERKNFVRTHINSCPTFESHYRRNESSKLYLYKRNTDSNKRNEFHNPKLSKNKNIISEEKKKDINSMIAWAPEADKEFLRKFSA
jgi:hypothetical protein